MRTNLSRRKFLRMIFATSATSLLAACGSSPAPAQVPTAAPGGASAPTAAPAAEPTAEPTVAPAAEPTPAPTAQPEILGEGDTEISMWVQDFPPAVEFFKKAAQAHMEKASGIKVVVQPIPYSDLQTKMLPAIAAGNEADVLFGYTDWYVATDITKLFLPLDDFVGGRAELEKSIFPSALTTLETPENKVYYVPFAAGIRAAALTLNTAHYKEKNIDYAKFTAFEDYLGAAKELTITDGGAIKRAGISTYTAVLSLVKTWIWQMGSEFYNREQGKWSLSSPEGEAALQRIYDMYWTNKVSSLDIFNDEYQGFIQELVSTQFNGAWTMGVMEAANEKLKLDCLPTPKLLSAKNDVVYPEHMGVVTLSRRLAKDNNKLDAAVGIMKAMLTADALIFLTETYSGSVMSKAVYDDPRINQTKYGKISKRIAEGTWPRARFPRDRVANQAPAQEELWRALRKQISVKEALANADTYLNDQEAQAIERLKS